MNVSFEALRLSESLEILKFKILRKEDLAFQ